MTQPALRLLLKICQRQERNEVGGGDLPALFFFILPTARMGLFSFGYLNKLQDGGEKGPWVLISCCCGKVNERGAAGEAGRVLHHRVFYDRPSVCALSHSQGLAVFIALRTRQVIQKKAGCGCYKHVVPQP